MLHYLAAPFAAYAGPGPNDNRTATPIKHVIVIIGENRSFDHVFATYVPRSGQSVNNLLSQGIVNADGTPGPNYEKARQLAATDTKAFQKEFQLSPPTQKFPGDILPTPLAGGPTGQYGYFTGNAPCPGQPTLTPAQCAAVTESGLPADYYASLASGGTGLSAHTPDTRIANVTNLPAGPFQLSPGAPSNTYSASPVHRFYQMWQQENCSLEQATADNPSGCNHKLFSWVEVTIGAGNNGAAQPPPLHTRPNVHLLQLQLPAEHPGATYDRRRLDRAGLLQRADGRRTLLQEPSRQLCNERQLPSVRRWRHWRQPHHVWPWRRDLVQRWQWESRDAAGKQNGIRPRPGRWRRL
jgi:hypothetical protein